jgi:antirestriction protein ArdC
VTAVILDTRFHRIALQRPEATRVAGFNAWLKVGRAVRKGERGIAILAPCVYKSPRDEEDQEDEVSSRVLRGFKVVHVFDVAQTEGEPLPEIARRLDSADDYPVLERLRAVAAVLGYTVAREDLGSSTNGDCNFVAKRIRVHSEVSDAQAVKTLVHELAHAVLHDGMPLDRARAELEAESVAYMVCSEVGVDSGGYSFGYLAGWGGGGEEAIAAIKACGDRIAAGARRILELLEETE